MLHSLKLNKSGTKFSAKFNLLTMFSRQTCIKKNNRAF